MQLVAYRMLVTQLHIHLIESLEVLMVSIHKNRFQRSPRGINWTEVGRAYGSFMADPSKGILHIQAAARHSRWQKLVIARLRCQAKLIADRPVNIDLQELVQLPADTLGGAYARHMLTHGFTPDTFVDEQDDPFEHRLAVAHDVQHIITGFDSSPIGEFGLAAFMLVQYRDLLNVFVLSWGPWSMIGNPLWIPKLLAALYRGFIGGWHSRPLAAYAFEDNWQRPLKEVRRELRIC
jgi:ubiquinone biosynthesis protein Coq4